jgi:hypothetical protein
VFDHGFSDRYSQEGIYGIIKVARYRHDYQMTVYRIAQRIVDVASAVTIAPGQAVPYASLPNIFGTA